MTARSISAPVRGNPRKRVQARNRLAFWRANGAWRRMQRRIVDRALRGIPDAYVMCVPDLDDAIRSLLERPGRSGTVVQLPRAPWLERRVPDLPRWPGTNRARLEDMPAADFNRITSSPRDAFMSEARRREELHRTDGLTASPGCAGYTAPSNVRPEAVITVHAGTDGQPWHRRLVRRIRNLFA